MSVVLGDRFARELPQLAVPWQAAVPPDPRLLVLNEPLAVELGLDPDELRSPAGVRLLVGAVPAGAQPVAQVYGGHQFGGWNPGLGDGRALLLGELTTPDGRLLDLHLKGSGRTPFSRGGDGLAAVGPMLREYVVSEAMHALGIPTTRALAVVATGTTVRRETPLPGAVLARVASSHLRVGSVVWAAASGDRALLQSLVDHAIDRHHPGAAGALGLLDGVVRVQAELVARWMLAGFVHGVMNTDNMLLSGETIDYGPCAFLEAYDAATVFSSIDDGGRYAFGNQPDVGLWNLARLAEALLPLLHPDPDTAVERANASLSAYRPHYQQVWSRGMAAKLGLAEAPDGLVADLLTQLHENRVDHTSVYRELAGCAQAGTPAGLTNAWTDRWRSLRPDADLMDRTNPLYVPRNALVERALSAGTAGDLAPLGELLQAVTHPYAARPGFEAYALPGDAPGYRTFCGT